MQETREDEVAALLANANWYHAFEVLPGIRTPGRFQVDARWVFDERFKLPADLSGKRALDIGALDGPYTFELEARGAAVTAVDIQHPDHTGFNTAKRLRGSQARYIQGDVYDLPRLLPDQTFDLITFFGVWYHLKNPVLAFERINTVLAEGGYLLFEGEALLNHLEHSTVPPAESEALARQLSRSPLPLSLFYAGPYKGDLYNWTVPNPACVMAWLEATGFEWIMDGVWDDPPNQRLYGIARKGGAVPVDNPVWTPDELAASRGRTTHP